MQKRESFVKDKFFWSFFSCLFLVQLVWLLAFWPGLATYDTLSQWQQAITGSYNNAHPFFFTLLMRLSNFLVGSPWPIAFLQITFFSFLISWILASLKRRGVSKGYIFLALFLYAFWPQFGIFNVTLWKDIFYTLSALWVSFLVYLSLEDKSLKNYRYLILLGSILPVLFRHNGIIFLVAPYLLLLLFLKTERALVLKLFGAAIVIYFAFAFGVSSILNVRKAPLVSEAFRIKVVASIYHQENPNLTDSEKNIFNKLITEKDWKANYDCAYVDNLYLNYFLKPRNLTFNDTHFADPGFESDWHRAATAASIKNPLAIIRDRACLAKYVLGVGKYGDFYVTENLKTTEFTEIAEKSQLPAAKPFLAKYLQFSSGKGLFWIFWATWIQTIVFLVAFVWSVIKKKWSIFAFSSLALANVALVILVSPAADGRYLYLTSLSFFVFLGILLRRNQTKP